MDIISLCEEREKNLASILFHLVLDPNYLSKSLLCPLSFGVDMKLCVYVLRLSKQQNHVHVDCWRHTGANILSHLCIARIQWPLLQCRVWPPLPVLMTCVGGHSFLPLNVFDKEALFSKNTYYWWLLFIRSLTTGASHTALKLWERSKKSRERWKVSFSLRMRFLCLVSSKLFGLLYFYVANNLSVLERVVY